MYIDTIEALFLTFVIISSVYLVHLSNLKLMREQAKVDRNKTRFQVANAQSMDVLESLRKTNHFLELVLRETKEKKVMCFEDSEKECDICHGACPYRNGGEWKR